MNEKCRGNERKSKRASESAATRQQMSRATMRKSKNITSFWRKRERNSAGQRHGERRKKRVKLLLAELLIKSTISSWFELSRKIVLWRRSPQAGRFVYVYSFCGCSVYSIYCLGRVVQTWIQRVLVMERVMENWYRLISCTSERQEINHSKNITEVMKAFRLNSQAKILEDTMPTTCVSTAFEITNIPNPNVRLKVKLMAKNLY